MSGSSSLPRLSSLLDRASRDGRAVAVGSTRQLAGDRISFVYRHAKGAGEYLLTTSDLPAGLRRPGDGGAAATPAVGSESPIAWWLRQIGADRLVPMSAPGGEQGERLWLGVSGSAPLPDPPHSELATVPDDGNPAADSRTHLSRIEQAGRLLPEFLRVLEPAEIFDRVVDAARHAFPASEVTLRLFTADLRQSAAFRSGAGAPGDVASAPFPAAVIRAWAFGLVDDLARDTPEAAGLAAAPATRSALRLPVRFDGRGGGLARLHLGRGRAIRRRGRDRRTLVRRRRGGRPVASRRRVRAGTEPRAARTRREPRDAGRVARDADRRARHPRRVRARLGHRATRAAARRALDRRGGAGGTGRPRARQPRTGTPPAALRLSVARPEDGDRTVGLPDHRRRRGRPELPGAPGGEGRHAHDAVHCHPARGPAFRRIEFLCA